MEPDLFYSGKSKDVSLIIKENMIQLSFTYADLYKKDGKNFIQCFKKYQSIKEACVWICWSYPKIENRNEKIDEFVKKLNLGKWERVLSDVLQIIYFLLNGQI
jgi:hypothetical protein